MIFLCNMLMLSAHIVFNISFDLMYDICYPLYVKATPFLFLLWLLLIQQYSASQDFRTIEAESKNLIDSRYLF